MPANRKAVKAELIFDMSNPIVQVVLPLKADAAKRAEQYAKQMIERMRKALKTGEWDQNKVAPYPSGGGLYRDFAAMAEYQLCVSLTEWDYKKQPGSRGFNEPCIVKMAPARCKKFVERTIKDAEAQYDAFVLKLTEKIGKTKTASLKGNHIWDESFMTVVLVNGETQVWHTQQITNISKLGKVFSQWPTRKLRNPASSQ